MSNFALTFNMFCDMIDQIIDYNKDFVARKGYEKYLTDKRTQRDRPAVFTGQCSFWLEPAPNQLL